MSNEIENKALDNLLQRGVEIPIPKRSIFRYIGKKERKFILRQSYLGTLFEISKLALKVEYDETQLQADGFRESKILTVEYSKTMALIIAIALLNSKWKIKCFAKLFSYYLFWRLTPSKLAQVAIMVMQMNNYSDFINTIRLTSVLKVATPNLSPTGNGG